MDNDAGKWVEVDMEFVEIIVLNKKVMSSHFLKLLSLCLLHLSKILFLFNFCWLLHILEWSLKVWPFTSLADSLPVISLSHISALGLYKSLHILRTSNVLFFNYHFLSIQLACISSLIHQSKLLIVLPLQLISWFNHYLLWVISTPLSIS
jgi:hypothetical protein